MKSKRKWCGLDHLSSALFSSEKEINNLTYFVVVFSNCSLQVEGVEEQ